MIYNAAAKLQSADFSDDSETRDLLILLKQDLELLYEHAVHEDNIIFPEIVNNEPEMINELNAEHKMLEEKLNKIKVQLDKIEKTPESEKRLLYGSELNNLFNDFAASYLAHMNHEEETVLGASFKYLTNEELISIRTRIQKQIPSERYKIWLNWMLQSLNNSELIGLLGSMKTSAPTDIFYSVVETAQNIINPYRWQKIKIKINI
jgi:iron-sulfur cluster repair protein YtfE (RIC family)